MITSRRSRTSARGFDRFWSVVRPPDPICVLYGDGGASTGLPTSRSWARRYGRGGTTGAGRSLMLFADDRYLRAPKFEVYEGQVRELLIRIGYLFAFVHPANIYRFASPPPWQRLRRIGRPRALHEVISEIIRILSSHRFGPWSSTRPSIARRQASGDSGGR